MGGNIIVTNSEWATTLNSTITFSDYCRNNKPSKEYRNLPHSLLYGSERINYENNTMPVNKDRLIIILTIPNHFNIEKMIFPILLSSSLLSMKILRLRSMMDTKLRQLITWKRV